jgi:hypothetical protein
MVQVDAQALTDDLFGETLELHERREGRVHKGETLKL